jgi:hypothetical protein
VLSDTASIELGFVRDQEVDGSNPFARPFQGFWVEPETPWWIEHRLEFSLRQSDFAYTTPVKAETKTSYHELTAFIVES